MKSSTVKNSRQQQYAGISSEIETITPETAREMLAKNTNNRAMNNRTVRYYEMQMKNGQWDLNGEAIIIANDGTLLDGQHRLEAVSRSGVTIDSVVTRGVQRNVFTTIDNGKSRGHADCLTIAGYEHDTKTLAASARVSMFFGNDGIFRVHGAGGKKVANRVSPEDIVLYVDKHPGLQDSQKKLLKKVMKLIPPAIAIGCHYAFSMLDGEKADYFFDRLCTGSDLSEGNPILALRNRLISQRGDGRAGEGHRRMLTYYVVHAWNAYMAERQLKEIKYQPSYEIKIDNFAEHVLSNWG